MPRSLLARKTQLKVAAGSVCQWTGAPTCCQALAFRLVRSGAAEGAAAGGGAPQRCLEVVTPAQPLAAGVVAGLGQRSAGRGATAVRAECWFRGNHAQSAAPAADWAPLGCTPPHRLSSAALTAPAVRVCTGFLPAALAPTSITSSARWPATALVTPGPATRQCCGSAADCTQPSFSHSPAWTGSTGDGAH